MDFYEKMFKNTKKKGNQRFDFWFPCRLKKINNVYITKAFQSIPT